MNARHLSLFALDDPLLTIQPRPSEPGAEPDPNKETFDLCGKDGRVLGYVKTWMHADGFAGYVRFDLDGNIQQWEICGKPGSDLH